YTVYLTEPGRNRGLPGDLRRSADDLRDQLRSADRLYDQGEIQRMLPPDTVVQSVTRQRAEIQAVGVTRLQPLPPTTAAVRSRERLTKGARYQMTSSLSEARDEDLRQAGTDYPGWVQDHYLQLPRSVPDRVRRLAREWTDPYATPYDKAAAIERRLRMDYTYSLDILAPPQGVDGVDYFLFTLKRGYADYYASAMVVLLRSLGIPARVAVGYVPGEYDHEKEAFVVRETHAHSWPEVYFPRYGWIEFNPTPAWPVLRRTSQDPGGPGIEEEDLGMPPDADPDLLLPDDEEPSLPTAVSAGGIDWAEVLRPYAYLLAVLSLLVLVGRTAWLWGLSGLDVAAQAYEKVCRLSALAGVRMRPQDTPWEYAQRVGAAIPPVRASVLEIAQAYMRHMFGKGTAEGEEARRIDAAWRTVRSALLLKALRWRGRRR
ncbi:MAG: transglutaminase domain-containing protein, partial [Chloroflexi bacterium]|nr:transglutaminase domain-containing protein [Chloroflexota bacterium]